MTSASNGKIALELLKTKTFDICFMDFLMPVMSGVDAIVQHYEWLLHDHERTHNRDMLVVGLSESTTDEELKLVFNHGCHFFSTKPPQTHILSSIINIKRHSASLADAIAGIREELDHSGIHGCYRFQKMDEDGERNDSISENVKLTNHPRWESKGRVEIRQTSDLTQSGGGDHNKYTKRESFRLRGMDESRRMSTGTGTNGGWKIFNSLTNPFSKK